MRPIHSRAGSRMIVAWSSVFAAIAVGVFVGTPSAAADTRVVTVNTGSGNLNVRSAPSTDAALLGTIRNGTRFVITCYVHGAVFAGGPYGGTSDIWNRRQGGGFTTDRLLDTGSNEPVVPACVGQDAQYPRKAPAAEAVSSRKVATPG